MEEDPRQHLQLESVNFPVKGMESVLATVSGYHGAERFNLIRLISHAGASYVGNMTPSVTHLICWKFEGRKYELAKKFKMVIVSHRWIEECVKKGRRVSEKPYTFQSGEEVGHLLLDMPLRIDPTKTQSKALKNSKRPIIHIDYEDTYNAASMDSLLLDERDKATTSQSASSCRVEKRNSTSVEPQPKARRLVKKHISRNNDLLLPSNAVEDFEETKTSTPNDSSLVRSDSLDPEGHQHIFDNKRTSDKSCFTSDVNDAVEEINHVNDENQNASVPDAPSSLLRSDQLSCVICWTDFCSTRGVLPCGHRFCFSCIEEWAHHMASTGKSSTCPLCKTSFTCITKIEDVLSSDQKIYSQSFPHDSSKMDLYILPDETYAPFTPPSDQSAQVCCRCLGREPEDLLVRCHVCLIRCVHCYCLDPPLFPWTCIVCQQLRMLTFRSR